MRYTVQYATENERIKAEQDAVLTGFRLIEHGLLGHGKFLTFTDEPVTPDIQDRFSDAASLAEKVDIIAEHLGIKVR